MLQFRTDSVGFHKLQRLQKFAVLTVGKFHVLGIRAVGSAEVGKDALDMQVREVGNLRKIGFKLTVFRVEADTGHTRIQLKVHIQHVIGVFKLFVQFPGVFQGVYFLGNIHKNHGFGIGGWGVTQDKNRRLDLPTAQLNSFLNGGHRQIGRAKFHKRMGHGYRTVSIGVGLDDRQEICRLGLVPAQGGIVLCQNIQIDLRPCAS